MISSATQQQVSPNDWLALLMSSDDSALELGGHGEGGGLLDSIMKMFMTMLLLSMQMESKSKEAIPLNTLANHILAKTDQMQQSGHIGQQAQDVARQYEQGQEREQVRGIR